MKREEVFDKQVWIIFELERAHIMRRMSLRLQFSADSFEKIEHALN